MQLFDKKYFQGYLNGDDDPILIEATQYVNLQDFRFGSSETGFVGDLESVGSTTLIENPNFPPTGVTYRIGCAEDIPNRRLVFFLWNSDGNHGIYCYDANTVKIYTVLLNSQLTGGLNFDKYHPIHSAFVANGCAYWTNDQINEPRRIDIVAGITLNDPSYNPSYTPYTAPLDISIISWIRRQPGIPPTAIKVTQTTPTVNANLIVNIATQYSYRYVYRNYEIGTLSGWSNLMNFNFASDTFNRIDITLPLAETIQQDVIQIDLCVLFLVSDEAFIINSWQTSVSADAAAIAAHNAGTQALTYSFYNNKVGIALDETYVVKQFDAAAIYAGTCATAKNRGFQGNLTSGYNTPTTTSLTVAAVPVDAGSTGVVGNWKFLSFKSYVASDPSGPFIATSLYLLDITDLPDPSTRGFYTVTGYSGPPPPLLTTVDFASCVFAGAGIFDVMNNLFAPPFYFNVITTFSDQGVQANITGAPSPTDNTLLVFKSGESLRAAITFHDYYGRRCGIVTSPALQVTMSERSYTSTVFTQSIAWTLSNTNALAEIPVWAYYYSIDLTRCLYTRYFQQVRAVSAFYVTKDPTTNANIYTTTVYATTCSGIGIDITSLTTFGQGYIFNQGDLVKLYTITGLFFILAITAQDGQWLVLELANIGVAGLPNVVLAEIYTPYVQQADEPYYEINQIFQVAFPTTANRVYSVIAGNISGDTSLLTRNDGTNNYLVESMSPDDTFYRYWFVNVGRPNFIDTIGQTNRTVTVAFTNTYIANSKDNGLSTFDSLDTKDLSPDYAVIMRLILTSKIELTGSIMLAICPTETAALYLGENLLTTTTGQQQLTQTTDVIGFINALRGSYGTLNPESVLEYKGNVYWFDVLNAKAIQYSDSGLFPISNYKMTRFWKEFADQYQSMSKAQIEALGSRPFIFTGVDPHYGEILFSIPAVLAAPPNGLLPGETNVPYPWDIYDGAAKTIVYKLIANPNKWQGSYSITAEGFGRVDNDVVSWKNGQMYQNNSTSSYCNYYGVQYQPKLMFVSNAAPSKPKVFNNISVQGNVAPVQTIMQTIYPYVQITDLISTDYGLAIEGVWYAQIYRDRLTPGFSDKTVPAFVSAYDQALYAGDVMKATYMYVMHIFDPTIGFIQIKFSNTSYALSYGHVTQ